MLLQKYKLEKKRKKILYKHINIQHITHVQQKSGKIWNK